MPLIHVSMDKGFTNCVLIQYAMVAYYRRLHEVGKTNDLDEIKKLQLFFNNELYRYPSERIPTRHAIRNRVEDAISMARWENWEKRKRMNEQIRRLQDLARQERDML